MLLGPRLSRALLLAGALLVGSGAAARPAPEPPTWSYVVRVDDLARGIADVELRVKGPATRRLCLMMEGGGRFVEPPRRVSGDAETPLMRDPDDGDCFLSDAPLTVARYRHDLGAMAAATHDTDFAIRQGEDYVLRDGALLLHPDPPPPEVERSRTRMRVRFVLPPGVSVAAPWRTEDGGDPATGPFLLDEKQYEWGSYMAIGKLARLGEVAMEGGEPGRAELVVIDRARVATDDDLRRSVRRSASSVARFYGELPGGPERRTLVILAPVQGSPDSGVFGSVLRRGAPSVVLLFGAAAPASAFAEDWVGPHELFHLGNPFVKERKLPWFIEGFTTYYQDVVRGRRGPEQALAMWGDLYDACHRFGDPDAAVSLDEESRRLPETHHYDRVYWGGACMALRLDVAIRERSRGAHSLDDLMRALRRRTATRPVDEKQLLDELDRAAGGEVARRHLRATRALPLDELYRQLGLEPTGKMTVRLHDDAPLAWVRRAIF